MPIQVIFLLLLSFFANAENTKVVGIVLNNTTSQDVSQNKPSVYGKHGYLSSRNHYVDAINDLCPGVAVVFLEPNKKNVEKYASIIDGLLIPGNSNDIDPKTYGEKPILELPIEKYRTDFEIAMIQKLKSSKKPILGICGGMQVINVALGGTLYQDLPTQKKGSHINHNPFNDGVAIIHEIEIDNHAHKLFDEKVKRYAVNSVHHQAVSKLGDGLTAFAKTDDGIIEGIISASHPFLVGVQWHPEFRLSRYDESLIKSFCNAITSKDKPHIQARLAN